MARTERPDSDIRQISTAQTARPIFCVMWWPNSEGTTACAASCQRGDCYSIGQLAQRWERDPLGVRRMIAEGKLVQEESGSRDEHRLREFYRDHGTEVHASGASRRLWWANPEISWRGRFVAVWEH